MRMVSGVKRSEDLGFCPKSTNRVIRGGSWNNNARNCRSANRNRNNPDNRNNNNGFRLVLLPAQWPWWMPANDPGQNPAPALMRRTKRDAALMLVTGGWMAR